MQQAPDQSGICPPTGRELRVSHHRYSFVTLIARALPLCVLLPFASALAATDDGEKSDHVAVLELGATGEREISEHSSHIGPAVGIELEPIENWLEVEAAELYAGVALPVTARRAKGTM